MIVPNEQSQKKHSYDRELLKLTPKFRLLIQQI